MNPMCIKLIVLEVMIEMNAKDDCRKRTYSKESHKLVVDWFESFTDVLHERKVASFSNPQ